jgi:hypothetical protein
MKNACKFLGNLALKNLRTSKLITNTWWQMQKTLNTL